VSLDRLEILRSQIQPLREQLIRHRVYAMVNSVHRLRTFMERHVFAVWDFMSLLKALQQSQTCVEVPWRPKTHSVAARLVNEIVLGEESDEDGKGGYTSHFELYREAMLQSGASTASIDRVVKALIGGMGIIEALIDCHADPGVAEFVRSTWAFVCSGKPHAIAAAFTFGREDVIPEMFRQFVCALDEEFPQQFERIRYYLARHIELDENSHAPMAIKVMHELCGNDTRRWEEATLAAQRALQARIQLWDAIAGAMPENEAPEFETARLEPLITAAYNTQR
jgi:hypothetical protein